MRNFNDTMRIGILTFHSQLNYGGVLQCWALQTTLQTMGHEVVVIDRWLHADNHLLECGFNKWRIGFWTKFLLRAIMGSGDWAKLQRVRKTKGFLKAYLNLTPYHFVEWKDAPKDLGIDMLVVGSIQGYIFFMTHHGFPRLRMQLRLGLLRSQYLFPKRQMNVSKPCQFTRKDCRGSLPYHVARKKV